MYVVHDAISPSLKEFADKSRFRNAILKYWPTKLVDGVEVMDILVFRSGGKFNETDAAKKIYKALGITLDDLKYDKVSDPEIDYEAYGYDPSQDPGTETIGEVATANPTLTEAMAKVAADRAMGRKIRYKYKTRDYKGIEYAFFELSGTAADDAYDITVSDLANFVAKHTPKVLNPLWVDDGKGTDPDEDGHPKMVYEAYTTRISTDSNVIRGWVNPTELGTINPIQTNDVIHILQDQPINSASYDLEDSHILTAIALLDKNNVIFDKQYKVVNKTMYNHGQIYNPTENPTYYEQTHYDVTYTVELTFKRKDVLLTSSEVQSVLTEIVGHMNSLDEDCTDMNSGVTYKGAAAISMNTGYYPPNSPTVPNIIQSNLLRSIFKTQSSRMGGVNAQLAQILFAMSPLVENDLFYVKRSNAFDIGIPYVKKSGLATLNVHEFAKVVPKLLRSGYKVEEKKASFLEQMAGIIITIAAIAVSIITFQPQTFVAVVAALSVAALAVQIITIAIANSGNLAFAHAIGKVAIALNTAVSILSVVTGIMGAIRSMSATLVNFASTGVQAFKNIVTSFIDDFMKMTTTNQILAGLNYIGSAVNFFVSFDQNKKADEINKLNKETDQINKEAAKYKPNDIDRLNDMIQSSYHNMWETSEMESYYDYVNGGIFDERLKVNE